MKPVLGLVVALEAEARSLMGRRPWERGGGQIFLRSRLQDGTDLMSVRSGIGVQKARTAARWLVSEGVDALAVLGVSGGLGPRLRSGDLIVGQGVLEECAAGGNCVWRGNSKLVGSACAALRAGGLSAHMGTVITVHRAALSTERKRSIYRQTQALAVDMESSAVARTASEAGISLLVLRAICDSSQQNVSEDLSICLDQDGRVSYSLLLSKLWRNPLLVVELLCTRKRFVRALRGLRSGWGIQVANRLPALLVSPD
jgi:adenosylhomocysteine nucleosidase